MAALAVFLIERTGLPIFLALLTLTLSTLLISILAARRTDAGLTISREVPESIFAGDPVEVKLLLANSGPGKSLFFIVDNVTSPEGPVPINIPVDALRAGESRSITYSIDTRRRGVMTFGSVTIEGAAPFGLLRRQRSVELPGTTLLYPFPGRVEEWDTPGGMRSSGIGTESLDHSGATHEYFATREYHPEDPMKHIHWKLTAKMQRPMVREFQTTSSLEVEMVICCAEDHYRGANGTELMDSVVAVAASTSAELIRRGHFLRLWSARKVLRSTFLESGSAHLDHVLSELAQAVPDGSNSFADALSAARTYFTPRAAVICILTHHAVFDTSLAVAVLAKEGFSPQIIVVEPKRALLSTDNTGPRESSTISTMRDTMARAGVPGWLFFADDDFRRIRMLDHRISAATPGK